MHVSILAKALVNEVDDPRRNRKSQAFTATASSNDESVNPDHVAIHIHEWAATVARIDRCVGLDVYHRLIWVGLSRHGTYDPHCHCALQAFRAADREYQLALMNPAGRA